MGFFEATCKWGGQLLAAFGVGYPQNPMGPMGLGSRVVPITLW